jgi:hypothetical protein
MGEETIKAIDELRQQVEAVERGLDDPLVKNWLSMAGLALMNAQEQLGGGWNKPINPPYGHY